MGKNEYNVCNCGCSSRASSMSDDYEEDVQTDEREEQPREMPDKVQLEGYQTVFDNKVSLTPVELVPLSDAKR